MFHEECILRLMIAGSVLFYVANLNVRMKLMENTNKNTEQLIEAILFWKGESISRKRLAELCGIDAEEMQKYLSLLELSLEKRGIVLVRKDDEVMLGTNPMASKIIEDLTREELSKELSKATLETLSIVLYMSPIKRSSIDYIRGVNSQFSLRHLEMRGLVEKINSDTDSRVYLYRPTFEAFNFLGITRVEDIPGYKDVKEKLGAFQTAEEDKSTPNTQAE
jgi:segregation and condensation protein B